MKNIKSFSVLLIIFAMLFTCSCEKAEIQNNNEEVCNFEVTAEPFEEMEKIYAHTDVYGFESEAELFDSADLVFIGMPTRHIHGMSNRILRFERRKQSQQGRQILCVIHYTQY